MEGAVDIALAGDGVYVQPLHLTKDTDDEILEQVLQMNEKYKEIIQEAMKPERRGIHKRIEKEYNEQHELVKSYIESALKKDQEKVKKRRRSKDGKKKSSGKKEKGEGSCSLRIEDEDERGEI